MQQDDVFRRFYELASETGTSLSDWTLSSSSYGWYPPIGCTFGSTRRIELDVYKLAHSPDAKVECVLRHELCHVRQFNSGIMGPALPEDGDAVVWDTEVVRVPRVDWELTGTALVASVRRYLSAPWEREAVIASLPMLDDWLSMHPGCVSPVWTEMVVLYREWTGREAFSS